MIKTHGIYREINKKDVYIIVLASLGVLMSGLLAAVFSEIPLFTLLVAFFAIILVFSNPFIGLIIVMGLLYLPVFTNVNFGPIEFSVTAFPVLGLAAAVALRERQKLLQWPTWLKLSLAMLVAGFLISTAFSTNLPVSLQMLPNLLLYIIIIFVTNALISRREQLILLAKAVVIMALVALIWNEVDSVLNLPRLRGINGVNMRFLPAFAICLVGVALPVKAFSTRWRVLMALVFIMVTISFIRYETRASWLAGLVMFVLVLWRAGLSRGIRIVIVAAFALGIFAFFYQEAIQRNLATTEASLLALQRGEDIETQAGDELRVAVIRASRLMIMERPLLGWGPNVYHLVKPHYVTESYLSPNYGAWNSWLLLMVDIGLIGSLPVWVVFLAPIVLLLLKPRGGQDLDFYLAYGFAVGVIGLAVDLFFIDLIYNSFIFLHVGLALAAVRLSIKARGEEVV